MDEARVRKIVREEIEAAGVMRVARRTPEEEEAFTKAMVRSLADQLLAFQREGGTVVLR